jgi:hypothetical protein
MHLPHGLSRTFQTAYSGLGRVVVISTVFALNSRIQERCFSQASAAARAPQISLYRVPEVHVGFGRPLLVPRFRGSVAMEPWNRGTSQ